MIFTIHILDATGAPVDGADFSGQVITPLDRRGVSGKTGADGMASVVEPAVVAGELRFELTGVTGAGFRYTPALNLATQAAMQSNSASFTITPASDKSGTDATFEVKSNRPVGDWIVRAKAVSTVQKGNFKGGSRFSYNRTTY